MATDYLSLFAGQHNFKVYRNEIYGVYNGYNVCVAMQGITVACYFSTTILDEKAFYDCLATQGIQHGIVDYKVIPPFVSVISQNVPIQSTLDFVTQLLALCKSSTSELCPVCQLRLSQDDGVHYTVNEIVSVAHAQCIDTLAEKINRRFNSIKSAQKPWYNSLINVFLVTIIMTLVSTILSILGGTSFTSIYLVCSVATGYIVATVYLKMNGQWGLPMYALCFVFSALSTFAVFILTNGYLIMSSNSISFGEGILEGFHLWSDPSTSGTVVLAYVFSTLSAACGIALKEMQRINFVKQTYIKIKRI